jgi:hypothetical protein
VVARHRDHIGILFPSSHSRSLPLPPQASSAVNQVNGSPSSPTRPVIVRASSGLVVWRDLVDSGLRRACACRAAVLPAGRRGARARRVAIRLG